MVLLQHRLWEIAYALQILKKRDNNYDFNTAYVKSA